MPSSLRQQGHLTRYYVYSSQYYNSLLIKLHYKVDLFLSTCSVRSQSAANVLAEALFERFDRNANLYIISNTAWSIQLHSSIAITMSML